MNVATCHLKAVLRQYQLRFIKESEVIVMYRGNFARVEKNGRFHYFFDSRWPYSPFG